MAEPVAYTLFSDGVMRPVFGDARGQFVVDDDGCKVRGVWFIPPEVCELSIVVDSPGPAMPKRLTTPAAQEQFITDNTAHLAAFAWEGFQRDGRGVVAVEADQLQGQVAHHTRFPSFLAFVPTVANDMISGWSRSTIQSAVSG